MVCFKLSKLISHEKVTISMLLHYYHLKIGSSNKRDVNENRIQDLLISKTEKNNFKEKTDQIESEELLSIFTPNIIDIIKYNELNTNYISIYNHYKCIRLRNCLFVLKMMVVFIKVLYILLSKHTTLFNIFWAVPP